MISAGTRSGSVASTSPRRPRSSAPTATCINCPLPARRWRTCGSSIAGCARPSAPILNATGRRRCRDLDAGPVPSRAAGGGQGRESVVCWCLVYPVFLRAAARQARSPKKRVAYRRITGRIPTLASYALGPSDGAGMSPFVARNSCDQSGSDSWRTRNRTLPMAFCTLEFMPARCPLRLSGRTIARYWPSDEHGLSRRWRKLAGEAPKTGERHEALQEHSVRNRAAI